MALELLLRQLVYECQRRDPQFAERSRNALDTALGMLRAEDYPNETAPLSVARKAKTRTMIREILEVAEKAVASIKPLTLRRRILNWFERG